MSGNEKRKKIELQSQDDDKGKSQGVTDNPGAFPTLKGQTALVHENVMRTMMFKEMLESTCVVPVTQRQRQFSVEKQTMPGPDKRGPYPTFQLLILDQLYLDKVSKVKFLSFMPFCAFRHTPPSSVSPLGCHRNVTFPLSTQI